MAEPMWTLKFKLADIDMLPADAVKIAEVRGDRHLALYVDRLGCFYRYVGGKGFHQTQALELVKATEELWVEPE